MFPAHPNYFHTTTTFHILLALRWLSYSKQYNSFSSRLQSYYPSWISQYHSLQPSLLLFTMLEVNLILNRYINNKIVKTIQIMIHWSYGWMEVQDVHHWQVFSHKTVHFISNNKILLKCTIIPILGTNMQIYSTYNHQER